MKGNLKTTAEVLLLKAASDEAVLSFALVSDSIVGFHAQQAVEKLMKALLTQLKIPYELTHSLNRHELIETVRILREHIVARIAALAALP